MRHAVLFGVAALGLSACSDPKAASEGNFKTAINTYIAQNPPCLSIPRSTERPEGDNPPDFPRYVSAAPTTSEPQAQNRQRERAPFDALVEAGLLKVGETAIKVRTGLWGNQSSDLPVRAYDLTPEGRKAVSQVGERTAFTSPDQRLCYGKPTVDEIVQFTEPADAMGVKVSRVSYRYHLAELPEWAKQPAMLAAFPQLKRDTQSSIDANATILLTNDGWIHERAFKR
ncbi:hypothetical protein FHS51_001468 [Sphingobium wenxiniae]|uniref:Lipoprotein n=1 Tax=Sphingobium wenxiniae (strain DSM 21828 / CGMCC 1.7748 / JZ-1) TaxID=595605 RepID=A0A562KKQ5_SPHWJ|nr:hypothetical protein [Sphingobium wenxiniae]MBB6191246.1 hypothetical protein [Sphingobium wenxiniae]TWH95957.1 hypothetical protein IQ35_01044 [Sphingobium wenxiniae]